MTGYLLYKNLMKYVARQLVALQVRLLQKMDKSLRISQEKFSFFHSYASMQFKDYLQPILNG